MSTSSYAYVFDVLHLDLLNIFALIPRGRERGRLQRPVGYYMSPKDCKNFKPLCTHKNTLNPAHESFIKVSCNRLFGFLLQWLSQI